MSTVHQDSDNPPCVPPTRSGIHRVLGAMSFPGGAVELDGMVLAHPGGAVPTTVTNTASNQTLAEHTVSEMLETLAEVNRLIGLQRFDEARFELGQVRRLTEEAQRWLE